MNILNEVTCYGHIFNLTIIFNTDCISLCGHTDAAETVEYIVLDRQAINSDIPCSINTIAGLDIISAIVNLTIAVVTGDPKAVNGHP